MTEEASPTTLKARDLPDGAWVDSNGWVHRADGTIDPIASAQTAETRAVLAEVSDVQARLRAAIAALDPPLHPVANAIHELRRVLPAASLIPGNPIPAAVADKLAEALEDTAKALGI